MNLQLQKYFLLLLIPFIFVTCRKEKNPVPIVPVNIVINDVESDPRYTDLRVPYNSVYVDRSWDCIGYKCNGVVIFRAKLDYAWDDYKAFDRTCTYEASSCAMEIDPAFPDMLVCPCCGSIYSMIGGYMIQGPAKFPLREFQCEFYNDDLRIY